MRKLTEDRWKSPKGDVGKALRCTSHGTEGAVYPCTIVGTIINDGAKFWTVEIPVGTWHHLHERPYDHDPNVPLRVRLAKKAGRGSRFFYKTLHVDKCKLCVDAEVEVDGIRCIEVQPQQ